MNTRTFLHQVSGLLLVTGLLCGTPVVHSATVAPEAVGRKVTIPRPTGNIAVGDTVKLTAQVTGFKSPTYAWSVVGPGGTKPSVIGARSAKAQFTIAKAGEHKVQVVVTEKGTSTKKTGQAVVAAKPLPALKISLPPSGESVLTDQTYVMDDLQVAVMNPNLDLTWKLIEGPDSNADIVWNTDLYLNYHYAWFLKAGDYKLRVTGTDRLGRTASEVVSVRAFDPPTGNAFTRNALTHSLGIDAGRTVAIWELEHVHPWNRVAFQVRFNDVFPSEIRTVEVAPRQQITICHTTAHESTWPEIVDFKVLP